MKHSRHVVAHSRPSVSVAGRASGWSRGRRPWRPRSSAKGQASSRRRQTRAPRVAEDGEVAPRLSRATPSSRGRPPRRRRRGSPARSTRRPRRPRAARRRQRIRALGHDRPHVRAHLGELADDPPGEVEAVRAVLDERRRRPSAPAPSSSGAARPGPGTGGSGCRRSGCADAAHVTVAGPARGAAGARGCTGTRSRAWSRPRRPRARATRSAASVDRARERLLAEHGEAGVERGRRHGVMDVVRAPRSTSASTPSVEERPVIGDGARRRRTGARAPARGSRSGSAIARTSTSGRWVNAGRCARSAQRPAPTMPMRSVTIGSPWRRSRRRGPPRRWPARRRAGGGSRRARARARRCGVAGR